MILFTQLNKYIVHKSRNTFNPYLNIFGRIYLNIKKMRIVVYPNPLESDVREELMKSIDNKLLLNVEVLSYFVHEFF